MISNEEIKKMIGKEYVFKHSAGENNIFITQIINDIEIEGDIIKFNLSCISSVIIERKCINRSEDLFGKINYSLYDKENRENLGIIQG